MIGFILKRLFGSKNDREIKNFFPVVEKINQIEESLRSLPEAELVGKTKEFRHRVEQGETLDDIMPEAFAVVKNACRRLCGRKFNVCGHELEWNMVPFDVQLIGAIVLHQGKIAEMATGEGKTLVATMPLYLNALSGKGAHLVTVNDYLARRDSQWMGELFKFLGLTVGCLQHDMSRKERRQQYQRDITYGTNSEFGFDYLRDNGALSLEEQVQNGHNYAIIDEVDSILIDEARTPLIISGPVSVSTHRYDSLKPLVSNLVRKQQVLCTRILSEAKQLLAQAGKEEEAGIKLFQVSRGMPKNKQFLKLIEDLKIRKLYDKSELELMSDSRKEESHEFLEQLFFINDEKSNSVDLTEKGRETLSPANPEEFIIPDIITMTQEIEEDESLSDAEKESKKRNLYKNYEESNQKIHNLTQLLRAYVLFEKDVDYVVQDNRVQIVDEFTGRLMPGRRFSEGLHQALEAKEGVKIERETQTFATITIQNYFRMYSKLAGMTGTAETEAQEFSQIYKLDVLVIPTNEPIHRLDMDDVIYKTKREKYNAIINEIVDCYKDGQPVLVGTISVETSELLSRMLRIRKIPHEVLNAKYHEKEAEIVAKAGHKGAVTIATNMAGRGTDIKLGEGVIKNDPRLNKNEKFVLKKSLGDEFKKKYGGLHIIGTERHESRRIDRQLRGRSGRQGDTGSSRFYISLEDDLMRLFGSERIAGIMEKIGIEEGQELAHPLLNRSIETAQKRVEQRNFSIRKHTLEYDDVMNKQREVIYGYRSQILRGEGVREMILGMMDEVVESKFDEFAPALSKEPEWDLRGFILWWRETFLFPLDLKVIEAKTERQDILNYLFDLLRKAYASKERFETPEKMRELEKMVALQVIDKLWIEHLYSMDNLRHDIGYRSYGQRDPLIEYKQESYHIFSDLIDAIRKEIVDLVFKASFIPIEEQENILAQLEEQFSPQPSSAFNKAGAISDDAHQGYADTMRPAAHKRIPIKRNMPKVGRNDPCP
ncbi:preprotein translocase subunit SecA, partial [bacterium]|nr:preprotein translocase subunit SecA [bacterium]